jgi:hypothetical protein
MQWQNIHGGLSEEVDLEQKASTGAIGHGVLLDCYLIGRVPSGPLNEAFACPGYLLSLPTMTSLSGAHQLRLPPHSPQVEIKATMHPWIASVATGLYRAGFPAKGTLIITSVGDDPQSEHWRASLVMRPIQHSCAPLCIGDSAHRLTIPQFHIDLQ